MQSLYQSERYLRLVEAVRAGDHAARHAIVAEGIAQSQGVERAHWLLLRAASRQGMPVVPIAKLQEDILEAMAHAPTDRNIRCMACNLVLGTAMITEQLSLLRQWLFLIPRALRETEDPFMFLMNLANLAWRRGRYGAALRYVDRALADMAQWTPERLHAFRGHLFHARTLRALQHLALGQVEEAERDVALATQLYETVSKVWVSNKGLTMAQARLALARGDLAGARSHLQAIWLRDTAAKTHADMAVHRVEADLIAGEIALAEGNRQAFDHFTGRALQLAEQHKLVLSARRILAIRRQSTGEAVARIMRR